MYEETLNQIIFIVFVAGASVPVYLTRKFGRSVLGVLSLLLALFLLFHGFYHLTEAFELDFYADVVLEPASAICLLGFAAYYYRKSA